MKLADFGLSRVFGSPDAKYTDQVPSLLYNLIRDLLLNAQVSKSRVRLLWEQCL